MRWDDLLGILRRAGFEPTEEDFMEAYGPVAADNPEVGKRHFRYVFGAARIDSLHFDAYVFPSEADAEEFRIAIDAEGRWYSRQNIVFHASPENMNRLIEVLEAAFEYNGK